MVRWEPSSPGRRPEASIESNELALRINPQDPTNFFRHFGLALAHYLAARYDDALAHARAAAQARPGWWLAQIAHAASLGQLGQGQKARHVLDELTSARPDIASASVG